MTSTFRPYKSDYGTDSEYSELVLGLQPELHHCTVKPYPEANLTKQQEWENLGFIGQTFLRILYFSLIVPAGLGPYVIFMFLTMPFSPKANLRSLRGIGKIIDVKHTIYT